MAIVQTTLPVTSARTADAIAKLVQAYPFLRTELLGRTAFQRPISTLVVGNGPRKVLFTAAPHANEWIPTLVLLKFVEDLARAITENGQIFGVDAAEIARLATIYTVPLVNPDGVDLVTGAVPPETFPYENARELAAFYPAIPFPNGWKANLLGVDLNLQYPAGWFQAREIKFNQGFTRPGPRDFVGRAPLDQLESRALAGYTEFLQPALILAYHTQGRVIYWKYLDIDVPGARAYAEAFARVSGYTAEDTPYASGFAGYKDWFIDRWRRPGFTVEVGLGENPLPLSQFEQIYKENIGILTISALGEDFLQQGIDISPEVL